MSNLQTPFRYDYVGSFLRRAELKRARAGYEVGTITAKQLKAVEDTYLTGVHPFVEHYRFVKALEDETALAKQTIPSPAQTLAHLRHVVL